MTEKSLYRLPLEELRLRMNGAPNSLFAIFVKATTLINLNMRYEKIACDKDLSTHPYTLVCDLVSDAHLMFDHLMEMNFIESPAISPQKSQKLTVEEKNKHLWQEIWPRYNADELQDLIDFRGSRLDVNDLRPTFEGKKCVDFGCGNGSFAFALLERGAASVDGIDFGKKQVDWATTAAKELGHAEVTKFKVGDILNSGFPDDYFEFGLSNAVFHHLRDKRTMERALRELNRVLKTGSGVWYYIDGSGAVSHDLWDMTVDVLAGIEIGLIGEALRPMNLSRRKFTHILDACVATYIHSDWNETVAMLERTGFGNIRRLNSEDETSWDLNRIEEDRYGHEKFGGGEIRIYCEKIS